METAELNRRIQNLIRLGKIAEVDEAARKVKVQSRQLTTDWLPWPAEIGRNYKRWRPLRIGTQVLIACIGGDPAQAVIVQILYTDTYNSPSTDPNIDLIQFDDGSLISYDSTAHQLRAQVNTTILTMNRTALTLTSNGSTIILDGAGIELNGVRLDLNQ